MSRVRSFAPIADRSARVLILGSMPGVRSLAAAEYYAHPQNAFWQIVGTICGFDPTLDYAARTRALQRAGIALWDVMQSCEREGSLDSAIVARTVEANDFATFFADHAGIADVLCNGAAAHDGFEKRARPQLLALEREIRSVRLPSTSPANAGTDRATRLRLWQEALAPLID